MWSCIFWSSRCSHDDRVLGAHPLGAVSPLHFAPGPSLKQLLLEIMITNGEQEFS